MRSAGRLLRWRPRREVTGRTLQGRLLLRPCQEFRAITLGILARAKRLYGAKIHSFIFLSNHSVNALLTREPLEGLWFDRTKEYAARRRGEDFDRLTYATFEILTLDPLPCWSGLPDDLYRERIASLLAQIEEKARAERERKGREPLGSAAILSQDPHGKPIRSKKSPAPRFHAFRRPSARISTKPTPGSSPPSGTLRRS